MARRTNLIGGKSRIPKEFAPPWSNSTSSLEGAAILHLDDEVEQGGSRFEPHPVRHARGDMDNIPRVYASATSNRISTASIP
jgi:hypothetical protein